MTASVSQAALQQVSCCEAACDTEAAMQPYLSLHPAPTGKTRDNSDLYGCSACRSKNCPRERQRNFGSAANCPRPAVRSRRNSQVRTAYSLPEYSTIAKQTTAHFMT